MPNDPLLLFLIVGIFLIVIVLGVLIWAVVSMATSSTGKKDGKQTPHTAQAKESGTSSESLPTARSSSQALGRGTEDTELLKDVLLEEYNSRTGGTPNGGAGQDRQTTQEERSYINQPGGMPQF
jgi:cytoskeletal protein RodZ